MSKFLKDNLNTIIDDFQEMQIGLGKANQIYIYDKERKRGFLNEHVEKYWRVKDYFELVKFFKSYDGTLEESIKKKFEYALKMTKKNNLSAAN